MLSTREAIWAAPLSRSHSNDRMTKLEFEGCVIVVAYEVTTGSADRHSAITTVRRTRWRRLSRGDSRRRRRRSYGTSRDTFESTALGVIECATVASRGDMTDLT